MLSILLIPASLTSTYGRMVGSRRQGWAIFAAMSALFIASVVVVYGPSHGRRRRRRSRLDGSPAATSRARSSASASPDSRCGPRSTTVTSCGAVNAAMESLTGIGGPIPMAHLG